jgi:glycosyltransferase involved in cell wall biosynthesis
VSDQPLVWVVTPVYNGERYLSECIESVLAQTYENWQYVVVDNCSSDGTPEIVRDYERRDARVRLHQSDEFLPIIANWNRALSLIPAEAMYCKVVHADDTLLPQCLELMVDVAERTPSVALVSSYALWGSEVRHQGVPYPLEVADGREICRSTLQGKCYVFGSPSSVLLRAADIRARSSFYNERNLHADTEVCFDLLREADLGFVHQILTRTRVHDQAMTPASVRINTFHDAWLTIHIKYGEFYLGRREYRRRLVARLRRYAVFLVKAVIKAKYRDPQFRKHHRAALGVVIESLSPRSRRKVTLLPSPPQAVSTKSGPSRSGAGEDAVERD